MDLGLDEGLGNGNGNGDADGIRAKEEERVTFIPRVRICRHLPLFQVVSLRAA
jgi:hypothetical protein